jgi:hypothetical protein
MIAFPVVSFNKLSRAQESTLFSKYLLGYCYE